MTEAGRQWPSLGPLVPRRGNVLGVQLARVALRLIGWRMSGGLPNLPKFVLIAAPHTSNLDFLVGMLAMFAIGLRGTFIGKHTLFSGPLGPVMRWLGGLPVNRTAAHAVVEQMVARFRTQERLVIALSPEGTRKKRASWHTGFYHVAKVAEVPIVPVAIDYSTRTVHIFPPFAPSDDVKADLGALGALFRPGMARYPDQY
jgi:1-acyl-sn-glycerol-3-phosphate acyltransferase